MNQEKYMMAMTQFMGVDLAVKNEAKRLAELQVEYGSKGSLGLFGLSVLQNKFDEAQVKALSEIHGIEVAHLTHVKEKTFATQSAIAHLITEHARSHLREEGELNLDVVFEVAGYLYVPEGLALALFRSLLGVIENPFENTLYVRDAERFRQQLDPIREGNPTGFNKALENLKLDFRWNGKNYVSHKAFELASLPTSSFVPKI